MQEVSGVINRPRKDSYLENIFKKSEQSSVIQVMGI